MHLLTAIALACNFTTLCNGKRKPVKKKTLTLTKNNNFGNDLFTTQCELLHF